MRHLLLSDVQSTNLQMLHVILLGAERDMVGTCRKYGLHASQAERLRTMTPPELWALVYAVGETSLFIPRSDLVALIDSPPALVGTLAAAHPPHPTKSRPIQAQS
ncbi:hypothetical protein [Paracidovorax anthurii]|uniref:Uncharacterized protein n=1 Tax=Paracidovorax anthurii TaxID=78229 RepID=A0A328YWJ2_9BURK|nr:hypothetical protein [Paracidovorax anthurii]RAR78190.1 hypothetical protein AX018_103253 [Paracidovorax anthurii]